MNRKIIKFRGRHTVSGGWYYGYLYKRDNDYIITTNGYTEYVVDKKTIGQCTGLEDKNGKEIYEGDIVKTFQENYQDKNNPNVNFFVVENETEYCGALSAFTFRCLNGNYSSVHTEALSQSEIIGNIYENPELLK